LTFTQTGDFSLSRGNEQAKTQIAGPDTDNHRGENAFVVKKLLAANVAATVVRNKKDKRVVGEFFVVESFESFTDFAVHGLHRFEPVGPVMTNDWRVGRVRR